MRINFGKERFAFDIENYYSIQLKAEKEKIYSYETDNNDIELAIKEYLMHSGYKNTLNIVENESKLLKNEFSNFLTISEDYNDSNNIELLKKSSKINETNDILIVSCMDERNSKLYFINI